MEALRFSLFCQLLNNIIGSSINGKQKLDIIFTEKFRSFQKNNQVYPFLRLLIPQVDNKRATYGVAEKKLARLLVKTLAWDHRTNAAARRIYNLNYQVPPVSEKFKQLAEKRNKARYSFRARITFGEIIEDVLLTEGFDIPSNKTITLGEIHAFLDGFQECVNETERRTQLFGMITKLNANQIAWLMKLIVKDLKLGISHEVILKSFHPNGLDFFNKNSDLELLCSTLSDISYSVDANISVFIPFKPMLASKEPLRVILDTESDILSEEKFDGERLLLHFSRKTKGLKMFTRNLVDYTDVYGLQFELIIEELFPDSVENIILDGEILAYCGERNNYLEFGKHKEVAVIVRDLVKKGLSFKKNGVWLCFMVFDILMVNSESLVELTQIERKLRLKQFVTTKLHVVEIVPYEVISGSLTTSLKLQRLKSLFKEMLRLDREGLILKYSSHKYDFKRTKAWFKLKKDFYTKLRDDFDVVVLGVKLSQGRVASLLVGIKNDYLSYDHVVDKLDPFNGFSVTDEYLVLVEVSAGIKSAEYEVLMEKLEDVQQVFDKDCLPYCIKSFKPTSSMHYPDYFVPPSASILMTVSASEIVKSDKYYANYTLRFPRILNPNRNDKSLDEIATYSEIFGSFISSKEGDITLVGEKDAHLNDMKLSDFSGKRKKTSKRKSQRRRKLYTG